MQKMINSNFKYDIAISLCKQDIEFARKLVKAINPSLKVFFYENRQEELINKSGPEVFSKIFKEQSRIVVILSRSEWSETFYTEIERNAIIDRTSVKNEGYHFLFVIPMVNGEIPSWYPSTKIYANCFHFSILELAHFIEFKVADEGGVIKSLTVEDRYQNFLERLNEKTLLIRLQEHPDAIESAQKEMGILKQEFNSKSDFLKIKSSGFSPNPFTEDVNESCFELNGYVLECKFVLPDEMYCRIGTTQDFIVFFKLFRYFPNTDKKELIDDEERIFFYSQELKGWSSRYLQEPATKMEKPVLFHNLDKSQFYDLKPPVETVALIDLWFQKLLSKSTQILERYL